MATNDGLITAQPEDQFDVHARTYRPAIVDTTTDREKARLDKLMLMHAKLELPARTTTTERSKPHGKLACLRSRLAFIDARLAQLENKKTEDTGTLSLASLARIREQLLLRVQTLEKELPSGDNDDDDDSDEVLGQSTYYHPKLPRFFRLNARLEQAKRRTKEIQQRSAGLPPTEECIKQLAASRQQLEIQLDKLLLKYPELAFLSPDADESFYRRGVGINGDRIRSASVPPAAEVSQQAAASARAFEKDSSQQTCATRRRRQHARRNLEQRRYSTLPSPTAVRRQLPPRPKDCHLERLCTKPVEFDQPALLDLTDAQQDLPVPRHFRTPSLGQKASQCFELESAPHCSF